MPWSGDEVAMHIREWGVELHGRRYDDGDVDRFVGYLDLGIVGWLPARVIMERSPGDETVRYAIECGPQRAITIQTEWHESGEHVCNALRELTDLLEELPRVASAIKAIEYAVATRRKAIESEGTRP